ncbi:MAG TPA: division/cell wall cluster transcriptional repressor MraZ [Roseiflexaceae bacterium]|nr:division/cell wall cluster transcriptional repressor MraZ [Roseiflexaceae bacterium]HMP40429.1 division/cell wall cluster transcriptional repressor MraZ [Roseiflexaceae bacterium]
MFLGEYEYTVDDKGRLAIPVRYREELGDGLVITRGFDGCLFGFPRPFWEQLAQQVAGLSLGQTDARSLQRLLFSGAADIGFDKQGRVLIPQNLREYAGMRDQVVIAGLNRYFEIWALDRWQRQLESLDVSASMVAQQIAALNI